jgi:uncharacterized membrane protein
VRRAYTGTTQVLSAILIMIGVAMIVSTLAGGGGPLAIGVVLGIGLTALGAARFWLARGGAR